MFYGWMMPNKDGLMLWF